MTINELLADGTFGPEKGIGFHMPQDPAAGLFLDLNSVETAEQSLPITGWLLFCPSGECYDYAETLEEAFVTSKAFLQENPETKHWLALTPSFQD